MSVFLDDYRSAPEGYVLAETVDECMDLLQNFSIEHLSLDHDLVHPDRNGFLLVQLMVKEKLFAKRITIHSANSVGGKAMYKHLKQAQEDTILCPSIIIALRPLPLNFYPPGFMEHYLETI
ncbi:cyclic-phosphate processing receiver domain-containing protein [Cytobacillus oceanisediminis]|uniref:cyclic-phosphate processing receiver domain-containing protein n=1 Tax=Cytobacillus oceanisediminis TaxID=665099 RepID=UPI0028111D43|nr:cyclic-phosphate processing receiver domain-containing protein [Cytobacillus oceanisediminis]